MKRLSVIFVIFLLPLALWSMDRLSETDLSACTANDSLNIASDTNTSRTFWSRYLNDPTNIEFLSGEDSGDSGEARASQTLEVFSQKLPEFTATVTPADTNDTLNAGMSRIQFPSGLIRTNEGANAMEVWLGGLPNEKNAGKMCDFYSNQIRSYTMPNSSISVSTH